MPLQPNKQIQTSRAYPSIDDTHYIPWLDVRLTGATMDHLWNIISDCRDDARSQLAGNISKSAWLLDKDNYFYDNVLKKMSEYMFYEDWNNYYPEHITRVKPLTEFSLTKLWVNYQKQHEFNPLHDHKAMFSFVVFMKIPTHWKEQHTLPISANSGKPVASNFVFVWTEKDTDEIFKHTFKLSPEDEGRILFFPGNLQHEVYPFYGTAEERVTVSGNILIKE